MNSMIFTRRSLAVLAVLLLTQCPGLRAQTDEDAIMMTKNNFCVGGTYTYSSWKDYWEGTLHTVVITSTWARFLHKCSA